MIVCYLFVLEGTAEFRGGDILFFYSFFVCLFVCLFLNYGQLVVEPDGHLFPSPFRSGLQETYIIKGLSCTWNFRSCPGLE